MKKLIVANWKLNPKTLGAAQRLLKAVAPAARRSRAQAVFCPPAPYLAPLQSRFPKLAFGAQDAFYADEGPYTGAVGPEELKSIGARFIIVGHSDRRAKFGETDADVNKKTKLVLREGLTAILCVGEPLAVRRKGLAAARRFVAQQVKKDLKNISNISKLVIAYEPVWSISTSGSGKKETPKNAAEMIRFIKKLRRARVLYGGSVDGKSAGSFLAYREIDGLLVGKASLSAGQFKKILSQ
jgi:triosephosphate isomerase